MKIYKNILRQTLLVGRDSRFPLFWFGPGTQLRSASVVCVVLGVGIKKHLLTGETIVIRWGFSLGGSSTGDELTSHLPVAIY